MQREPFARVMKDRMVNRLASSPQDALPGRHVTVELLETYSPEGGPRAQPVSRAVLEALMDAAELYPKADTPIVLS